MSTTSKSYLSASLILAAESAREGDFTKCAMYVENIAEVFFPLDGGDDPVWPNAANNAFKRAAYGLIDYYLEEEKELRRKASEVKMDPKVLEAKIDELWGKVTLYNCYQLFVQLTSKKMKNPQAAWKEKWDADYKTWAAKAKEEDRGVNEMFGDVPEFQEMLADKKQADAEAVLFEDKPEMDLLTLFFNASAALPKNSMRTLVSNSDKSRMMGQMRNHSCVVLRELGT